MKSVSKRLHKQQGGTLLGLIVGLIVGLGIAVAVALLITKSSSPFTNKNGNKAGDLPAAQLQDPNKPLYGNKDVAKEVAKDLAASKQADNPAAPANAAAPAANQAAAPAAAAPVAAAPAQAAAKPEAHAADAGASAAKADSGDKVYYLQAGAFRDQADAESARAKLALLGFEARINERASDTGNLYRVRIGPFNQVETMNRMRSRLSENGVDVAVVSVAK
jgi:cell division protein FtsN